mmetsp:Transcript_48608/g.157318  ORF Transcript_48608/g.157318 Transcript_48608/m.157318 type:complete len:371 (-) Transcript_48608:826-1938(-)
MECGVQGWCTLFYLGADCEITAGKEGGGSSDAHAHEVQLRTQLGGWLKVSEPFAKCAEEEGDRTVERRVEPRGVGRRARCHRRRGQRGDGEGGGGSATLHGGAQACEGGLGGGVGGRSGGEVRVAVAEESVESVRAAQQQQEQLLNAARELHQAARVLCARRRCDAGEGSSRPCDGLGGAKECLTKGVPLERAADGARAPHQTACSGRRRRLELARRADRLRERVDRAAGGSQDLLPAWGGTAAAEEGGASRRLRLGDVGELEECEVLGERGLVREQRPKEQPLALAAESRCGAWRRHGRTEASHDGADSGCGAGCGGARQRRGAAALARDARWARETDAAAVGEADEGEGSVEEEMKPRGAQQHPQVRA